MNWSDRLAAIGFLALWGAFSYSVLWALQNLTITRKSNNNNKENN